LIEIPYWWNRSDQTLAATIAKYRPELSERMKVEG